MQNARSKNASAVVSPLSLQMPGDLAQKGEQLPKQGEQQTHESSSPPLRKTKSFIEGFVPELQEP